MAESRVILSSDVTISSHTATVLWDTVVSYRREKDQVFYRKRVARDMVFTGLTYDALIGLNVDECEQVTVQIQRECGGVGVYATFITGTFNAGDWRNNGDDCEITVRIITEDDYACLLGSWKTPVNLYDLDEVEVKPYPITETYVTDEAYTECEECGVTSAIGDPANWCATVQGDYCTPAINPGDCDPGINTDVFTVYHRMEATGTCDGSTPVAPSSDDYWTLLTDNCPTDSTWWRCPGEDVNNPNSRMTHGRLFSDAIQAVFDPCGLTVVSDFFNINADATAPDNAAYDFAALYLQNMTVHQKSDVKRPYSSNPATSKQWDIQPKEMLDDLRILFNVYWDIDGTDIRIEHISYFETVGGLDASADAQKVDTERETDDNVKYEYFFFVDEAGSDYFLGSPIVYDCGTEKIENRCQLFSTDITYIQNTNSEGFADDNFVLCSTEIVDTVHYLIRDNRPLSFTELHENLHRHFRYWKKGTLNGSPVTFTSFRPTRKQPAFDHVLCCDAAFDEREPVTTAVGTGYIDQADYTIQTDIITLEIKH